MAAKIILGLLLLFVVSEKVLACQQSLCPVVNNWNCLCEGKAAHVCVCDFTCSEWDKPCNWVVSCQAEVDNINAWRCRKNKLDLLWLPTLCHEECLNVNVDTHKRINCCNLFCQQNVTDVCF
ncbi:hypothetical protein KR074_006884 [Drosophila pseudoananassae]|nr:hypothetical protein KR074_006884 [Drosophila pseudoananassae]